MGQDELYGTIFERKSVRKYDDKPLDEDTLVKINTFMSSLRPMLPGIRTELKFMTSEDVKGMFKVDAPHFVAIFSEPKEGYLANAGFLLQQIDLFLSKNGIGCCWQGGPKPVKGVKSASDLEFIILLAFGRPAEDIHRKSTSEFKREPLDKITDIKGLDDLLEPVRLAPSGMNNQPWFFTGGNGVINAYSAKSMMVGRMNQISVGISLYHLWLAAVHSGKDEEFIIDKTKEKGSPKGYSYVASMTMK